MRLAMPTRGSACSAQRGTENPMCFSMMTPTTCRGFWVVTPPGWAPLTPPCCKPSSVRVRVMVSLCLCVYVDLQMKCVAKWLEVCVFLCVCVYSMQLLSLQQVSADGAGGRHPAPQPPPIPLILLLLFCLSQSVSPSLILFALFLVFSLCISTPIFYYYVLLQPSGGHC